MIYPKSLTGELVIILFALLLSHPVQAQGCKELVTTSYDEVTGTTITRMKDNLILNAKDEPVMALFMAQKEDDQDTIQTLTFDSRDLGCILNGAIINFLFTDGTREGFFNISSSNCASFAMLYLSIPDSDGLTIKDKLLNRKVKTIRVNGVNNYVQADLTESDQEMLQKVLRCLK